MQQFWSIITLFGSKSAWDYALGRVTLQLGLHECFCSFLPSWLPERYWLYIEVPLSSAVSRRRRYDDLWYSGRDIRLFLVSKRPSVAQVSLLTREPTRKLVYVAPIGARCPQRRPVRPLDYNVRGLRDTALTHRLTHYRNHDDGLGPCETLLCVYRTSSLGGVHFVLRVLLSTPFACRGVSRNMT